MHEHLICFCMHFCMHVLQASFLNAQPQEPDWAEWYQQQDRLPDQSPAPTEVPTPSPSPPRADELAVPEMAPPPQNDRMAPHATLKVTSTTHRREFMALGRVANGPRALEFPEVARMFNGTKVEQRKVLAAYVQSGENLAAIEANFKHVRTHSEKYTANRKLMTVKDMRDAGFSEYIVCIVCMLWMH